MSLYEVKKPATIEKYKKLHAQAIAGKPVKAIAIDEGMNPYTIYVAFQALGLSIKKIRAGRKGKKCTGCKEVKEERNFYYHKNKGRYHSQCVECMKEKERERYEKSKKVA